MRNFFEKLSNIYKFSKIPHVSIDLMGEHLNSNSQFFTDIVNNFYYNSRKRHQKFLIIREFEWGVALCHLPTSFEVYFMAIEAAARRNYKKALRLKYRVERINFNDHLGSIQKIQTSTYIRQGKSIPKTWGEVKPCTDPISLNNIHDYQWYGVFGEQGLVAYASCFACGQVAMIEHILGHQDYLSDGIVPLLIIDIAKSLLNNNPNVMYYVYGTYFGASTSLRRFKEKFLFKPHRVTWILNNKCSPSY